MTKANFGPTFGIHWFRRDLRISNNKALRQNWRLNNGRVLGIFFFDSDFLSRPDFSHNRFGFFLKTLKHLQDTMRSAGGDLLVLDRPPLEGFQRLLQSLPQNPNLISWNRDYEPFARKRDEAVLQFCQSLAIPVKTDKDHLIIEPWELTKDSAPGERNFYQVYSPFFRKWHQLIQSQFKPEPFIEVTSSKNRQDLFSIQWSELLTGTSDEFFNDKLSEFVKKNSPHETITQYPPIGTQAALKRFEDFLDRIQSYQTHRDFPSIPGTSELSVYFKNGTLTTAMIVALLLKRGFISLDHLPKDGGAHTYLKEIAWREFYYHILYHQPRVERECFIEKYNSINWENNESYFEAWKEGATGFPIVDAGMRQLKQTGHMHNRVRMIVSSFLTKDLLINWQWGERHFMKYLLDGDLAPNNGGWQWAASTGCDPQPYFRIFNPWLQSEKFDPDAKYIKTWIPELKHESAKNIHCWTGNLKYPGPIVDHATQKIKALRLYKVE